MRLCHFTKSKQMFFSALNPLGNVELIIMHFFAPILKQTVLVQTYIYIHKMTNHFLAHNICHLFHPSLSASCTKHISYLCSRARSSQLRAQSSQLTADSSQLTAQRGFKRERLLAGSQKRPTADVKNVNLTSQKKRSETAYKLLLELINVGI